MRTLMLVALLLAGACEHKKDSAPTPDPVGSNKAPPPPAPTAAPGTIEVFVDSDSVAKVAPDAVAKWPRLDGLLPKNAQRLGQWELVTIKGKDKSQEIKTPSAQYPELVPVIFPSGGGSAFGMFDPVDLAKHGEPKIRVDNVSEIRVAVSKEQRGGDHQGGTGAGEDPMKLVIDIKTPTGQKKFTGAELLALPRETQPGKDDTKGWRLTAILKAVGITKFEKLVLRDAGGTTLPLEKADFDDINVVPFIKLNKQGTLRFRVTKKVGEGWQMGADLRDLTGIEQVK